MNIEGAKRAVYETAEGVWRQDNYHATSYARFWLPGFCQNLLAKAHLFQSTIFQIIYNLSSPFSTFIFFRKVDQQIKTTNSQLLVSVISAILPRNSRVHFICLVHSIEISLFEQNCHQPSLSFSSALHNPSVLPSNLSRLQMKKNKDLLTILFCSQLTRQCLN